MAHIQAYGRWAIWKVGYMEGGGYIEGGLNIRMRDLF